MSISSYIEIISVLNYLRIDGRSNLDLLFSFVTTYNYNEALSSLQKGRSALSTAQHDGAHTRHERQPRNPWNIVILGGGVAGSALAWNIVHQLEASGITFGEQYTTARGVWYTHFRSDLCVVGWF